MPLTVRARARGFVPVLLALSACAEGPPRLAVPTELYLGHVPLGESATASFHVRNIGDSTVAIDAIGLAEGSFEVWEIDADTTDLFAGSTSRVTVTFTPVALGVASAFVEIRADDPASDGLGVRLSGEGRPPSPQGRGLPGDEGSPAPGTGNDPGEEGCGDADGDGHDVCDLAGDCDDADPAAFPVFVDATAGPGGAGTVASPFATLAEALQHLDASCHEVVLAEGTHTASVAWSDGPLTVRGAGDASRVVVTPPAGARAFAVGAGGALRLSDLTLSGARLTEGEGGALRVEGGAATLTRVRAADNRAPDDGGALAVENGALALSGCTFSGNVAGDDGGAVSASDATVTDVGSAWSGNTAGSGGALSVRRGALTIDGARFSANVAYGAGGAVHVRDVGELVLERSTLHGNEAGWRGGGLYVSGAGGGVVRNNVVQDGEAEDEGGGISLAGATSLVVANNTLVANEADGEGGGLWIATDPTSLVFAWSNVVAHSEGRSGVWVAESAAASVAYTLSWDTEGDAMELPAHADDGGNLEANPRFVAFTDDARDGDDLSPAPGSPALDAGPPDGEGPDGHRAWADRDGTRNDRGHTGGPGAR